LGNGKQNEVRASELKQVGHNSNGKGNQGAKDAVARERNQGANDVQARESQEC